MATQASDPLIETTLSDDGTVMKGPLATVIKAVIVIGMGLVFYAIATGKIETPSESGTICLSRKEIAKERELLADGYVFSYYDHREHKCYLRPEVLNQETHSEW